MASPETAEALRKLRYRTGLFANGGEHEAYRRSVEHNWRAVIRHVRRELRRMKHGRISAANFEKTNDAFRNARKSYEAAINLYRADIWFGRRD